MAAQLNDKFLSRFERIIPAEHHQSVLERFSSRKPIAVRINSLKLPLQDCKEYLASGGLQARSVDWMDESMIIEESVLGDPQVMAWLGDGSLYRQNLSSMYVTHVLDPKEGHRVLDMCAAPGSKTSHIAARMRNSGHITALDAVRQRVYKLRSVLELTGVDIAEVKCLDARRFRTDELFDRVLVDAPCSSEGRFDTNNPKTLKYWSTRKIKEMVRKQRGLLLNAYRALRPGGLLVYSTCTFAPEENEGVLNWFLRKGEGIRLLDIECQGMATYSPILTWEDKEYNPQIGKAVRILPDGPMDGFFIALISKDTL